MTKIDPKFFLDFFLTEGINFFTGVPDSLLKNFTNCVFNNIKSQSNIIAPNEGSAVGLAIGSFIASQKIPLVYMQNSGLGNAINPLVSLADKNVMSIPMILLIGWRGEVDDRGKQIKDEPQHITQGKITLDLLNVLKIPYMVISEDINYSNLKYLIEECKNKSKPVALVVRKNIFQEYKLSQKKSKEVMTREEAINLIVKVISPNSAIVATTGMTSRELYEIRDFRQENHDMDFLTVGGMGHASSIAIGIAKSKPLSKVLCLDGDGALIMHMGILPYLGRQKNIIHLLLNNESHDSVGGQPTISSEINLVNIAKQCNFDFVYKVNDLISLEKQLQQVFKFNNKSAFIEINCKKGYRNNLGRPKTSPLENKIDFIKFLKTKK